MGALLFSHFRVKNVKLINEKISMNVTVWMSVNPQKSILFHRFLRISYNSISWGCLSTLKNRSGMDVVSNRRESIISIFRCYTPLGCRYLSIQRFWNVTFSYLQYFACSQILAFLAAFIDTLSWDFVNT